MFLDSRDKYKETKTADIYWYFTTAAFVHTTEKWQNGDFCEFFLPLF